ncbi:hypothetical protein Tco_1440429 [Tanacetum coccineum]
MFEPPRALSDSCGRGSFFDNHVKTSKIVFKFLQTRINLVELWAKSRGGDEKPVKRDEEDGSGGMPDGRTTYKDDEGRVKPSTSASGSQPCRHNKEDKFAKTSRTANVQHSKLNANSEPLCVKCNGCMLSDNHDLCVLDFINDVNARTKSKSVKKIGNVCPLTRITTTAEVPLRKPTSLESDTPKPVVTLVYSRKPKKSKTNVPVSKPKNIKSLSANKKEPSKSWGSIVFDVPSSSLDECKSFKLFYVNSVTKPEVAFRQQTYFIHNLKGVDLLTGSRSNNLYTLSFGDMMASSPICLLSKASKTSPGYASTSISYELCAINHLA